MFVYLTKQEEPMSGEQVKDVVNYPTLNEEKGPMECLFPHIFAQSLKLKTQGES